MADIRHRVGVEATPEQVYEALSTTAGLAGWWTRDVQGDPAVGGKLVFRFEDRGGCGMEVTELVPGERVGWRCVEGPPEWLGTGITFALSHDDGETVIMFTHAGWRDPAAFMHHCSMKWAVFLLSLKAGLEGRVASPFPDDVTVSRWS